MSENLQQLNLCFIAGALNFACLAFNDTSNLLLPYLVKQMHSLSHTPSTPHPHDENDWAMSCIVMGPGQKSTRVNLLFTAGQK